MQSNLLTTINARKVSLTVLFLALCVLRLQTASAQIVTQSSCFTMSITTSNNSCDQNNCDDPAGKCTYCYEVTITNNKCPGINLSLFTMTTQGDDQYDCRAVCDRNFPFTEADFIVFTDTEERFYWCSWEGPRYLGYVGNSGNGIPYNGSAKFILCRKQGLTPPGQQKIRYTFSCGCSCNGVPCTSAHIDFKLKYNMESFKAETNYYAVLICADSYIMSQYTTSILV